MRIMLMKLPPSPSSSVRVLLSPSNQQEFRTSKHQGAEMPLWFGGAAVI